MQKNKSPSTTTHSQRSAQPARKNPWQQANRPRTEAALTTLPAFPAAAQSIRTAGPSSTPGHQVTLQVMTLNGVFKTVVVRQTSVFEFLLVNAGSASTKEILCDSVATAKAWQAQLKKAGHRVQSGERRFGF